MFSQYLGFLTFYVISPLDVYIYTHTLYNVHLYINIHSVFVNCVCMFFSEHFSCVVSCTRILSCFIYLVIYYYFSRITHTHLCVCVYSIRIHSLSIFNLVSSFRNIIFYLCSFFSSSFICCCCAAF